MPPRTSFRSAPVYPTGVMRTAENKGSLGVFSALGYPCMSSQINMKLCWSTLLKKHDSQDLTPESTDVSKTAGTEGTLGGEYSSVSVLSTLGKHRANEPHHLPCIMNGEAIETFPISHHCITFPDSFPAWGADPGLQTGGGSTQIKASALKLQNSKAPKRVLEISL